MTNLKPSHTVEAPSVSSTSCSGTCRKGIFSFSFSSWNKESDVYETWKFRSTAQAIVAGFWPSGMEQRDYEAWKARGMAAAFHAVQEIASDALEPSAREARIKAAGLLLKLERRRVGALVRGARYFYVDHHATMDGSWVRFLKGDGERLGLVHVKALERVGRPSDYWQPGTLHVVHVANLQASPGRAAGGAIT